MASPNQRATTACIITHTRARASTCKSASGTHAHTRKHAQTQLGPLPACRPAEPTALGCSTTQRHRTTCALLLILPIKSLMQRMIWVGPSPLYSNHSAWMPRGWEATGALPPPYTTSGGQCSKHCSSRACGRRLRLREATQAGPDRCTQRDEACVAGAGAEARRKRISSKPGRPPGCSACAAQS